LLPHRIEVLGRRDLPGLLTELTAEIARRSGDPASAKAWSGYLILQGLHRARDLRPDPGRGYGFGEEDKANPAEQFAAILREGPEVGIHTLVWCDTYLNLERTLEGRALREFGHRVAGSMSQDDSMRLLDDAAAARIDRPHRLIKYDEDQVGVLEKFRPYRIPATAWLEHTAEALRQRVS
jgi:DNA segregation ATPase FtsK/SpoIIIE, S-DNA-T family